MMDSRQREEVIREYPINIWIPGLMFAAGGAYAYFRGMPLGLAIGGAGIGLLFVLFSSVLVVELADSRRTLLLRWIGIFRQKVDELPVGEIHSVFVQRSRSGDSNSGPSYRVVIAMKNGEIHPLRSYFSSGSRKKEKTADQIRSVIGIGGQDQSNPDVFAVASQLIQDAYRADGDSVGEQVEGQTDEVRWKTQEILLGAAPVTRWFSNDSVYPGQFLYITQKVEGRESGKKVMALMGKTLMRQSLRLYGFDDTDLPNLENAELLDFDNPQLGEDFLGYASDPIDGQTKISLRTAELLVDWAERHPLVSASKRTDNFQQLVVLFSPNGIYLTTLGELKESETEELVDLGVQLVKVQQG